MEREMAAVTCDDCTWCSAATVHIRKTTSAQLQPPPRHSCWVAGPAVQLGWSTMQDVGNNAQDLFHAPLVW